MADRNFYNKSRLVDVVAGSAAFAAGIASDYESLGLTLAQSDEFALLDAALQSSWTASVSPAARTSVAIQARDLDLKKMRDLATRLAKIIFATPTVDNPRLLALGLLPRSPRIRSKRITEAPVLTVLETSGRQIRIRVRDAGGMVRGKLSTALGALVYSFVGDTPPSGIEGWTVRGPITKDSAIISFDEESAAVGAKVWFAAQWFNTKGIGPGCTPVAAVIGVEGSLAV